MHALLTQSVGVTVSVSTPGTLLTSSLPRANWSVAGSRLRCRGGRARGGARRAGRLARPLPGAGAAGEYSASRCPRSTAGPTARSAICARWSKRRPPRMVPGRSPPRRWRRLLIGDPHVDLLEALASGERLRVSRRPLKLRYDGGRVSGTAEYVLGADAGRAAPAACR